MPTSFDSFQFNCVPPPFPGVSFSRMGRSSGPSAWLFLVSYLEEGHQKGEKGERKTSIWKKMYRREAKKGGRERKGEASEQRNGVRGGQRDERIREEKKEIKK